jgi:glycosyltransferase involved in cell wall biosynthesis
MRVTMMVRCLAMMRGGGETRHLAWMRELRDLGVEVDVIAGQPLAIGGARFPIRGVKATVIRTPYLRDWVYRFQRTRGFGRLTMDALHVDEEWFCRAAWREIASRPQPPDIVHAHALYQAARLRRGPSAVVLNFPGEPSARYAADIQQADALVGDGWAARHLPAMLGRPVHAVSKGVDAELFRPSGANLRESLGVAGRRTLLCVARLVPLKNVALLIEAMAAIGQSDPKAQLIIAGDGPEKASLRAQAVRLGFGDRITFTGHVSHEELAPLYRSADVFVLPSDFDNSPNVVLEAMACGLPVVATDAGGASEYVAAGQGGSLTPPRDAAALAAAVLSWLDDPVRRRNAGAFNRQRIVQQFSWRASAQRLLGVYEGVLAGREQRKASA